MSKKTNSSRWILVLAAVLLSACTLPAPAALVAPTAIPPTLPPTETATLIPTQTATASPVPLPTEIMVPSATSTLAAEAVIPQSSAAETVRSSYQYGPQFETPLAIPNFAHPDQGCSWMGVAGQVFNTDNLPAQWMLVEVGGNLNGAAVDFWALTGLSPAYGDGGYEVKIADKVIATTQALWVQLYDLNGMQLSDKVYFDTYEDCQKGLILLNFKQQFGQYDHFLPFIEVNR